MLSRSPPDQRGDSGMRYQHSSLSLDSRSNRGLFVSAESAVPCLYPYGIREQSVHLRAASSCIVVQGDRSRQRPPGDGQQLRTSGVWELARCSLRGMERQLARRRSGAPRNRPLGGVCDGPRSASGLSTPSLGNWRLLSIAIFHRGVLTQFPPPVTVTRAAGCRER